MASAAHAAVKDLVVCMGLFVVMRLELHVCLLDSGQACANRHA